MGTLGNATLTSCHTGAESAGRRWQQAALSSCPEEGDRGTGTGGGAQREQGRSSGPHSSQAAAPMWRGPLCTHTAWARHMPPPPERGPEQRRPAARVPTLEQNTGYPAPPSGLARRCLRSSNTTRGDRGQGVGPRAPSSCRRAHGRRHWFGRSQGEGRALGAGAQRLVLRLSDQLRHSACRVQERLVVFNRWF